MISALKTLWHRNRWLTIAFAVAFIFTIAFGVRTTMYWIWWQDPAHLDQPIEGWMTPRYVSMSWQVPPDVLRDAVGIADAAYGGRPPSLTEIADERDIPVEQLISKVDAAITQFREGSGE